MYKIIAKRSIALLIVLAFMLALFSCATDTEDKKDDAPDAQNQTDETQDTTELSDGLPDIDMQGYEFNIFNFDTSWFTWGNTRILAEEENGDIVNDALYRRRIEIEERFNCVLKTVEIADTTDSFKKNVTAGDNTYQLYSIYDQNFGALLPYMADCNELPYLRIDEKHWNPNATSIYNLAGKQFALAGNVSMSVVNTAICLIFNKKIYQNYYAGESMYEMVRDNKWTLDKFLEIASSIGKDTSGDGQWGPTDLYGISSSFKGYIGPLLTGTGTGFTKIGDDGRPTFNLHQNEQAIGVVTKLMDYINKPGFNYNEDVEVWYQTPDLFEPGNALFGIIATRSVDTLRVMEDDIGILPLPKLSESQERFYTPAFGNSLWAIPKTIDFESEGENIGLILEALSFAGYYDIIPQFKEVVLKTKSARDNESADMLDIIFDSVIFNFDMNILYDSTIQMTILPAMWKDRSAGSIISICEKNTNTIERYISDFYKSIDKAQ